jgi:hypothetical protein
MFHTKVVDEVSTHIFCPVNLFLAKNYAVFEIIWTGAGQTTDDNITRRIAWWITGATDTQNM